jgi:hypothetical protein
MQQEQDNAEYVRVTKVWEARVQEQKLDDDDLLALDALTAEYKRKTEELEARIKAQENATKDCEANYEKWDEAMNEYNTVNVALDTLILAKNAASDKLLAGGFQKADAEVYMEVSTVVI